MGDIIVLPDLGWLVEEGNKTLREPMDSTRPTRYAGNVPGMRTGLQKRIRSSEVPKCIDLFPLLARLLHITAEKTDGNLAEVESMLIQ